MIGNIQFNRTTLFLGLLIAILITDSIIFFAEIKTKNFYSSWVITINASVAAVLAVFVLFWRKNLRGVYRKTRIALAIGLCLWLCADIIWAMYEIVLEIVPPVPSAADFLWLAAYGFLAYYLFETYLQFHKKFHFGKKTVIASVLGCSVFLSYTIGVTFNFADLSSSRGIAIFGVIIAYPILDAVLMVPAIVILVNFRKEPLWFTPWICESAGIFLIALSDSWFVPIILTSFVNQLWLSSLFFAAHYLVIAAGLLWYIKFLVQHEHEGEDHDQDILHTGLNSQGSKLRESEASPRSVTANTDESDGNYNLEKFKDSKGRSPINRSIRAISGIAFVGGIAGISIIVIGYTLQPTMFSSAASIFSWFVSPNSELVISSSDGNGKSTLTLGAILPLTGISSSLGESEEAALHIAVNDVNNYFSKINNSLRVELVIEDTQSNPTVSLEKLKQLAVKGIKIVIGPATSAELQAVDEYSYNNGILLVSPSSTAPSSDIRNDLDRNSVFRLVPDDTHQAQAISQKMWDDGVKVMIPFWRTDVYGNGLVDATVKDFKRLGGKVIDGIGYIPHTGDFSASLNRINFIIWDQDLKSLENKVHEAVLGYGPDKVGVYVVAFDEIAPIFIQSQYRTVLPTVKWYGSDGSALNNNLIRNIGSANFAFKTNFSNPIFAVDNDNDENFKRLENEMHKILERVPRSYASVAYDIFWIASLTENSIKMNGTQSDLSSLKEMFEKVAKSYKGITGNTSLNNVGDRKYGDYDFWAIRSTNNDGDGINNNDGFAWKRVGKYIYNNATNTKGFIQILP